MQFLVAFLAENQKLGCDQNFNKDCIKNFLGEDIVNSRLVQDSKIPPDISENFENPLSIEELDISAEQGNRSASGKDGLSNCFITKYWDYLRIPLHRYSTYMLPYQRETDP
jgi:hypothetical protein